MLSRKILHLTVIIRKMKKKSDLMEVVVFSDWTKSRTIFIYLGIKCPGYSINYGPDTFKGVKYNNYVRVDIPQIPSLSLKTNKMPYKKLILGKPAWLSTKEYDWYHEWKSERSSKWLIVSFFRAVWTEHSMLPSYKIGWKRFYHKLHWISQNSIQYP